MTCHPVVEDNDESGASKAEAAVGKSAMAKTDARFLVLFSIS